MTTLNSDKRSIVLICGLLLGHVLNAESAGQPPILKVADVQHFLPDGTKVVMLTLIGSGNPAQPAILHQQHAIG